MGKRSDFERIGLDFYPSPWSVMPPLIPHLKIGSTFCEPCAGAGHMIDHLEKIGLKCVSRFDVSPQRNDIKVSDASFINEQDLNNADTIITNPPWDRPVLHQIIERCSLLRPTWLLFDADWAHTKQAKTHLEICRKIIAVGRVKWIEDSAMAGKDNCCWHLFDAKNNGPTIFYGRSQ